MRRQWVFLLAHFLKTSYFCLWEKRYLKEDLSFWPQIFRITRLIVINEGICLRVLRIKVIKINASQFKMRNFTEMSRITRHHVFCTRSTHLEKKIAGVWYIWWLSEFRIFKFCKTLIHYSWTFVNFRIQVKNHFCFKLYIKIFS